MVAGSLTASVGVLLFSFTPTPLPADERVFAEMSRMCAPDSPPERAYWLALATAPGASSPLDFLAIYQTRMRALYPGQRVCVRYRTSVNGVMGAPAVVCATVGP